MDDNPYAAPQVEQPEPLRERWWKLIPLCLVIWTAGFFVLMIASVCAGFTHYSYLAHGFDYRSADSRELARLTQAAGYWLIPALSSLVISLLLLASASVQFAIRLIRTL